jgi:peptide/nickel transport system permease protein
VELAALALLFALSIALPVGILSATRRGSALDSVATVLSLAGAALPNFWLAIILILIFSLQLRWFPPSGFVPLFDDPLMSLKLLVLPAIGLGTHQAAVLLRLVRSSTLEVLGQDYVRTARAKGLREQLVLRAHVLPNGLIPVVTILGLQIGTLLGGSVITEHIFALPGIGRYLIDNIYGRDYPVVQGVVLFMSLVVMFCSLLVDLVYTLIDPRIQYG